MSNPAFVVPLADLERGPKEVHWTISVDWLRQALSDTEAVPNGEGELDLELTKTGRDVMVRGLARASVTMPCSRTLDPVEIAVAPEIFLMLRQLPPADATARGRGRAGKRRRGAAGRDGKEGREGARGGWGEDPVLSDEDAARDTFAGEQVALDSFVREFILLELPMFPMRSDLPSDAPAAIAPPSPGTEAGPDGLHAPGSEPRRIDPRLAPLAAIKSRLKKE